MNGFNKQKMRSRLICPWGLSWLHSFFLLNPVCRALLFALIDYLTLHKLGFLLCYHFAGQGGPRLKLSPLIKQINRYSKDQNSPGYSELFLKGDWTAADESELLQLRPYFVSIKCFQLTHLARD